MLTPEQKREYDRAYRKANREKQNAQQRVRKAAVRAAREAAGLPKYTPVAAMSEAQRAAVRRYREKSRDRVNAQVRAKRAAERDERQAQGLPRYDLTPKRREYQNAWQRTWRKQHTEQEAQRWQAYIQAKRAVDPFYRRVDPATIDTTPLPMPYTGHPMLDEARMLAGDLWYGDDIYNADREDAAGEAVLAMLEGRDPQEAVRAYYARAAGYQRSTTPWQYTHYAQEE